MRSTRSLNEWQAVGVAQRSCDVLLKPRRQLIGFDARTGLKAPWVIPEWLGRGACQRGPDARAERACYSDALPEQCTPVNQTVSSYRVPRRITDSFGHDRLLSCRRLESIAPIFSRPQSPVRVKSGKAQNEQMFSSPKYL